MKNLIILTIILFTVQFFAPIFGQNVQNPELIVQTGHSNYIEAVIFRPDGKLFVTSGADSRIILWETSTGKQIKNFSFRKAPSYIAGSYSSIEKIGLMSDNKTLYALISYDEDESDKLAEYYLWKFDLESLTETVSQKKLGIRQEVDCIDISKDDYKFIYKFENKTFSYNTKTGKSTRVENSLSCQTLEDNLEKKINLNEQLIKQYGFPLPKDLSPFVAAISPNKDYLVAGFGIYPFSVMEEALVKVWNTENKTEVNSIKENTVSITQLEVASDQSFFAFGEYNGTVRIVDLKNGTITRFPEKQIENTEESANLMEENSDEFPENLNVFGKLHDIKISPNSEIIAIASWYSHISLWNRQTDTVKVIGASTNISNISFSPNGESIAYSTDDKECFFVNIVTGVDSESSKSCPTWFLNQLDENSTKKSVFNNVILEWGQSQIDLRNKNGKNTIASIYPLRKEGWVVVGRDGRFDTNILEKQSRLHWIIPGSPITPLPLEIFMREYYEPSLFSRLLKCNEENNCDKEFKPVRNLADLNRTQPQVAIAEIKQTASPDVVEVTVEAEETISEYQKDKQNKALRSGVADLRLFRDGQLVGYAPDTEGAVTLDKNGKFTKAFSVRLPKNTNAKEFNFTAYAFNADRVKSETAQRTYTLPKPLLAAKGSAFIVTIGVNANEDRRYDLRYAANDARRLQEELAKRLPKDKYDQIVQIPLISDYNKTGKLAENNAMKAKIRTVFDKLAGKTVSDDALKDVPNKDSLKKVQPEDLVLIAFSGHGYADREGIFYLVPHDIGKSADGGLAGVLGKSISSDELSVWLRDVDAGEMMMIVDACHSAAAVQGKDFKPGPMGSRGLGQLAYDKGMRILTATQADNFALELGNLEHGLLTYSLIKNGIELSLADYQPPDNKLFSGEWLGFAVKDVPELYKKILKGEVKGLTVGGVQAKSEIINANRQKSNLNLQQPTLFDFNRRDRQFELINILK